MGWAFSMISNAPEFLYLYAYCDHAFLENHLHWQHSKRRVTPEESGLVDLANDTKRDFVEQGEVLIER
jgi:multidrug resistance efflux pump